MSSPKKKWVGRDGDWQIKVEIKEIEKTPIPEFEFGEKNRLLNRFTKFVVKFWLNKP
jgi:hypothetical protein